MNSSLILIGLLLFVVSLDSHPAKDFNTKVKNHGVAKQAGGVCLAEHNAYRQKQNITALSFDKKLETASRKHNDVMVRERCFSHQCKGEPKLGERVNNEGYAYTRLGENIAGGQRDCKHVMEVWMNSSGHKANILGEFKHVGCSLRRCHAANCQYRTYWTCVFGNPK